MRRTYKLGTKPRFRGTFRLPSNGSFTDPTTVTIKIKPPTAGAVTYIYNTDPELEKISTGVYEAAYTLNEAGLWKWTYTGTSANDAIVVEGEILCEDPGF